MDFKNRIKNYGFWISLASFITLILPQLGVEINLGKYNEIVNSALSLLVMLGILNNPTTENSGFSDDKIQE